MTSRERQTARATHEAACFIRDRLTQTYGLGEGDLPRVLIGSDLDREGRTHAAPYAVRWDAPHARHWPLDLCVRAAQGRVPTVPVFLDPLDRSTLLVYPNGSPSTLAAEDQIALLLTQATQMKETPR